MSFSSQESLNARWAIVQTLVSAGVLFFLYRFLLKELGAEKLGLWSLILASTSLARIGELGFSNATLRFVGKYMGADKPDEAAEVLETAIVSIALPIGLLLVLAIPLLAEALVWFVPERHLPEALIIVPWALLALWLSIVGGLAQSAIDGCGRMDRRNMALIVTNGVYLAFALSLTPKYGLKGVAIAQAIQSGVTLLIMWKLAKMQLSALPIVPYRWSKKRFREVISFAVSLQVGSIAGMLVEPVTKALISKYGGLGFLAYYEMANQVVSRARAVLLSGFQALLPTYAATDKDDLEALHKLNNKSATQVTTVAMPLMAALAISFPLISLIWTGVINEEFVNCGILLSFTWFAATLCIPAYFFLVGTGRGWHIAVAHLLMLACTAIIGSLFGLRYGGYGVVVGALASLLIANAIMQLAVNNIFASYTSATYKKVSIYRENLQVYAICFGIVSLQIVVRISNSPLQVQLLFNIFGVLILSLLAYYKMRLTKNVDTVK